MTGTMSTDTRERIEHLGARIVALRDAYYRGEPLVSDADYDAVEDELRALVEANPELTPDPNPLEEVGAPSVLHAPVLALLLRLRHGSSVKPREALVS